MESINYSVRINPIIPNKEHLESKTIKINTNDNTILVNNSQLFNCKIERLFNEKTTQKEVFDYMKPILDSTLNNTNSTVLILGERESGKNYSMFGEDWCLNSKKNDFQNNIFDEKKNIGILPRYIIQLINNIDEEIKISCNFIMIYNENVYDLLNDNINNLTQINNLIYFDCADLNDFLTILKEVLKLDWLERLRYTSPYPTYYSDELLALHENEEKLCPHIHIPFQSWSDEVLKRMFRGYSTEDCFNIRRKRIRKKLFNVWWRLVSK